MDMTQRFQILGAKKFKGDVEGQFYDSTKLYVVMDVSDTGGNEIGKNVQVLRFGKSDEFDKIKHLQFPIEAELAIKLTTKGLEVVGFKGVKAAADPVKG